MDKYDADDVFGFLNQIFSLLKLILEVIAKFLDL